MLYDFENASLVNSKELILQFQKSKDKKIFETILGIFDTYLVYLLKKFKRNYKILRYENEQELYHIAVIGFYDGVLKLHSDWREDKILLWLGSYVKMHLLKEFKYKNREVNLDESESFPIDDKSRPNKSKFESIRKFDRMLECINLKDMINEKNLTKNELELIDLKYYKGMAIKDIAKLLHRSSAAIFKRHQKLCEKLKKRIQVER